MSRLIDAEEVLNAINRYAKEDGYINLHIGTIDSIIGNVSTIKRPHGEWILDAVSPCSIAWFRCSYCGYKYEAYKQSNFCPNCGASMVKEGDSE